MLPREEAGLPKGRLGSQPSSDLTCTAPWTAGCSEGYPVATNPALESPLPRAVSLRKSHPGQAAHGQGLAPSLRRCRALFGGRDKGFQDPSADKTTAVHALEADVVPPCSDPLTPV